MVPACCSNDRRACSLLPDICESKKEGRPLGKVERRTTSARSSRSLTCLDSSGAVSNGSSPSARRLCDFRSLRTAGISPVPRAKSLPAKIHPTVLSESHEWKTGGGGNFCSLFWVIILSPGGHNSCLPLSPSLRRSVLHSASEMETPIFHFDGRSHVIQRNIARANDNTRGSLQQLFQCISDYIKLPACPGLQISSSGSQVSLVRRA